MINASRLFIKINWISINIRVSYGISLMLLLSRQSKMKLIVSCYNWWWESFRIWNDRDTFLYARDEEKQYWGEFGLHFVTRDGHGSGSLAQRCNVLNKYGAVAWLVVGLVVLAWWFAFGLSKVYRLALSLSFGFVLLVLAGFALLCGRVDTAGHAIATLSMEHPVLKFSVLRWCFIQTKTPIKSTPTLLTSHFWIVDRPTTKQAHQAIAWHK